MSSSDYSKILQRIVEQLGLEDNKNRISNCDKCDNVKHINLNPSELLVVAGILGGVLEATSVLMDRNQNVQIVLQGTLKKKTELEKTMDTVRSLPFEEVLKAMLGSK